MLEFLHIFLTFGFAVIKLFAIIISILGGIALMICLTACLNDFFIKRKGYSEFKSGVISIIIMVFLTILILSIVTYVLQSFGIVNTNFIEMLEV